MKLSEVASFIRGITFKPRDVVPPDTPGTVQCMRTKNVQAEIDLSDVWSVDASFVRRTEQYITPGDILVSSANSWNLVGKCCWVPELSGAATFGGFISVLRPNKQRIDARYLYHWFSSERTQAVVRSFGRQTTNISNLDFARCLQLDIPTPLLSEQKRIAQVLDSVDALRSKRREALALLDELAQSLFLDMFGDPSSNPRGWTTCHFGELSGSLRNGLSPSNGGAVEARVLTLSAITGDRFKSDALKVASFNAQPPAGQSVSKDNFLICRGNGNLNLVGRGFFPDSDMPDVTFPDTMIAASPSPGQIQRIYLQMAWSSAHVRQQIEAAARTTNGTFKINQSMLEEIQLAVPPLDLQQQFAKRVEAIEAEKAKHQASLGKLDELFNSVQSRAFAGTLFG